MTVKRLGVKFGENRVLLNEMVIVDLNKLELLNISGMPKKYSYKLISYDWGRNKLDIQYEEIKDSRIKSITFKYET